MIVLPAASLLNKLVTIIFNYVELQAQLSPLGIVERKKAGCGWVNTKNVEGSGRMLLWKINGLVHFHINVRDRWLNTNTRIDRNDSYVKKSAESTKIAVFQQWNPAYIQKG